MKKLGLKMSIVGLTAFAVSFITPGDWGIWIKGISVGFSISSIWASIHEYKNQ
jgi:hypothetical protein